MPDNLDRLAAILDEYPADGPMPPKTVREELAALLTAVSDELDDDAPPNTHDGPGGKW